MDDIHNSNEKNINSHSEALSRVLSAAVSLSDDHFHAALEAHGRVIGGVLDRPVYGYHTEWRGSSDYFCKQAFDEADVDFEPTSNDQTIADHDNDGLSTQQAMARISDLTSAVRSNISRIEFGTAAAAVVDEEEEEEEEEEQTQIDNDSEMAQDDYITRSLLQKLTSNAILAAKRINENFNDDEVVRQSNDFSVAYSEDFESFVEESPPRLANTSTTSIIEDDLPYPQVDNSPPRLPPSKKVLVVAKSKTVPIPIPIELQKKRRELDLWASVTALPSPPRPPKPKQNEIQVRNTHTANCFAAERIISMAKLRRRQQQQQHEGPDLDLDNKTLGRTDNSFHNRKPLFSKERIKKLRSTILFEKTSRSTSHYTTSFSMLIKCCTHYEQLPVLLAITTSFSMLIK